MRPEVPHPLSSPLDRWLAAERDGHDKEAEAALLELCAVVPRPLPPAGFASRVLVRALAPGRQAWLGGSWLRALAALCLAATSWALLWLPATLAALAGAWRSGDLQPVAEDLLGHVQAWIARTLVLGHQLVQLDRAFSEPLATPATALLATVCLMVSAVSFRLLSQIITRDRRWVYADPI